MKIFIVNDKPAVKIFAKKIVKLDKATKFDCEGDILWIPNSVYKEDEPGTILIQEWFYNVNLKKSR